MNIKHLLFTTTLSSTLMISSAFATVKHYDDSSAYTKATGKTIPKLKESPYIKKYMPKLAPINVRLKDLDPLIEQPTHEIGTYGGQANVMTMAPYMAQDAIGFMPLETLLGLESDNNTVIAGYAQSYTLSKDMKSMTFTLRKGLKWSDGVPVTSQELYNWHKYINEGLKVPTDLNTFKFTVVNSRVFTITLDHANSFMPYFFANFAGMQIINPFHYIKHFMPQFNKHVGAEAKKAGYRTTEMYTKAEINSFTSALPSVKSRINVPTLRAYVLTKKANDHWTFTRNPYYWKVDTAGNQLPYIDKLQVKLMNNSEVLSAKVMSGEADYSKYINIAPKITVFKQNEKKGHYKTYVWSLPYSSVHAITFNMAYNGPEKVKLKVIHDIRFRKALSLSIDRNKINETLFYGKSVPAQWTVNNTSKYYNKKYAEAYAQYDPKQANKLLDEMGLKWNKSHTYRLTSDGKVLSFLIRITSNNSDTSVYEMLQTFAGKVGIKFILKQIDWVNIVHNVVDGNINLISAVGGAGTTDPVVWITPTLFVPFSPTNNGDRWGLNYAKWLDANRHHKKLVGVEPPQSVKDLYNTHLKLLTTNDPAERAILADKILKFNADNLYVLGMVANPIKPMTARDNIGNIDEHGMTGADNKWSANYGPETRYFKRPLYKNQIIH